MRPPTRTESLTLASTIGEVIDHWGRATPEAPAIAARNRRDMSYGELAALTDDMARQLRRAGFGPESRLAIVHPGGAEMLTTVLGVVKCSVAVPVNSDFSAKELHSEIAATNETFKKVYESMTNYTNNGYQWFQVAELGYDSFMVRHSR